MKTKTDKELNALGQVQVNGIPFFIVALPHPQYVIDSDILTKFVLVSAHEFNLNNGNPSVVFA